MTQPAEPRRTSPVTPILNGIESLRQFLVPIVVVVAFNRANSAQTVLTAIAVTGIAGMVAGIGWLRLRWWIEEDRLRVRSGLLQIDDRTIPVARIQRVDRRQSLMARLFGVYQLDAETAGGSGSELTLKYLSQTDVTLLEDWLATHRAANEAVSRGGEVAPEPEPEVMTRVGAWDLVVAGATSNRLGALVVLVATAFQLFDDATADTIDRLEQVVPALADRLTSGAAAAVAIAALLGLAAIVGWITSIATTLIRYWEFELVSVGGDLVRTHGLVSRFRASSPRHRIQTVRIEQPILRRLAGRATVVAETAGSPGGDRGGSGVLTPIAGADAARHLTARVLGQPVEELTELEPVSRLTVRRAFIRTASLLIVPAAPIVWFTGQWPMVLVGMAAVSALYSGARYRALGFRAGQNHLVTRSGVLSRRTWSVPLDKVQTVSIRRSPFQRRLALATVHVDTAGGRARIPIIDLPLDVAIGVSKVLARRSTLAHNTDAV